MDSPEVIAFLVAAIVALFLYAVFVPKNSDEWVFESEGKSTAMKVLNYISSDIYKLLPQGTGRTKKRNSRIDTLLIKSGNPWNLSYQEFFFFRFVSAFLGALIGIPLSLFLATTAAAVPWWVVVPVCAIFGFMIPNLKYSDAAKKRDVEFKRQLPEALDLLTISLSAGSTFQQAMREVLPNMSPGILKIEFTGIVNQLDTGKTLKSALDDFASRAPNENIVTFVRAVQEATELNVPLVETLISRAEASRSDFFALIHRKTASLESKMMMALAPTMIPALLIVLVLPFVISLVQILG